VVENGKISEVVKVNNDRFVFVSQFFFQFLSSNILGGENEKTPMAKRVNLLFLFLYKYYTYYTYEVIFYLCYEYNHRMHR
jgi:hypothetical protein